MGMGIAAPVLPAYAKTFDVSFATAGLIIIVQPWGSVLATFPTGYMVDRVGRKPVLIAGPVLTAISAIMTAFAPTFAFLLFCRFLNGMSEQMWQQARLAMIADTGGDRERGKLITWMGSMSRFGNMFAPAIAGVVAVIDIRIPFLIHGILVLLILVPSIRYTRETKPELKAGEGDGDWKFIWSELVKPHMLWFLAAQIFANLTRGNIQAIMSLFMAYQYGRGPTSLGLIASANSFANIPIGFATGTIMDRYGRKKTVVPGFASMAVAAAFLVYTVIDHSPFWVFLIGYFWINMSQGITGGNMQVLGSDLAPARARGRFIGIWRMLAAFGNAGSPTIFSALATIGYAASFSFIGFCAATVSIIIAFKVKETIRPRERASPVPVPAPPPEPAATASAGTSTTGSASSEDPQQT